MYCFCTKVIIIKCKWTLDEQAEYNETKIKDKDKVHIIIYYAFYSSYFCCVTSRYKRSASSLEQGVSFRFLGGERHVKMGCGYS